MLGGSTEIFHHLAATSIQDIHVAAPHNQPLKTMRAAPRPQVAKLFEPYADRKARRRNAGGLSSDTDAGGRDGPGGLLDASFEVNAASASTAAAAAQLEEANRRANAPPQAIVVRALRAGNLSPALLLFASSPALVIYP
eukprot:168375-Chlamydomonas_euryale.AAC.1